MSEGMDRRIAKSPFRRRRLAIVGVVLVLLVAGAALGFADRRPTLRVPAQSVTVATVRSAMFHDFVALRAQVTPRDLVYLGALEGGQVQELFVRPGDVVSAGQPLVRFRNTALELEVLDREGRLVESITQLQTYEKVLEDARVTNEKAVARIRYDILRLERIAERRDALLARGFVSRDQHEAAHDELAYNRELLPLQIASNRQQDLLRRQQLPKIREELAMLQESLALTRSKLDSLLLRAPVSGRLTDMRLNVGEIRDRGERLGQIAPETGVRLEASIDEYYLDRVRPGQAGIVQVNGRTLAVRAVRVDPQVKNASFLVELAFDGASPAGLLPGQALDGRLRLGGDRQALVLPAGAFLERTGGDWALVLDGPGAQAERRQISVGRRNAEQVEILGGLQAGERVITSDYAGFEKIERLILAR